MKIIAEIGVNWESLEQAKKMIRRSKEVGCFASKFQLFTKKEAPNLPEYLYLTFEQAKELFEYGKSIEQDVFFTPMYDCIDFLEELGVEYYKIRYKDRFNHDLINSVIKTHKTLFISYDRYDFHNRFMIDGIILLCVPKYPASFEDYGNFITFGYSDHTPDFRLYKYAKLHGALYFEKHVKLEGTKPLENDWSVSFKELEDVLKDIEELNDL